MQGYLNCDCGKWIIYQFEYDRADQVPYEVSPDTVCEYTDLLDKNGCKIWENDIVKCDTAQLKGVVKYVNGMYVVDDIDDGEQDIHEFWNEVEVIGNIFDNPELLEV